MIEKDKMEQIEKQVSGLLKEYGYTPQAGASVDIVKFVQSLGFVVGNAKLPQNEDGFLAINPRDADMSKVIGVNTDRSPDWKRFIVAHEFAHSLLHYNVGSVYLHRENKKGKDEQENEADYFAAALLMPRDSFKLSCRNLSAHGLTENALYMQLASIYKVPLESAARRVKEVTNITV